MLEADEMVFMIMIDAQAFKTAFEQAQEDNSKAPKSAEEETSATAGDESVDKSDDEEEEKKVEKVEKSEGQTEAAKVSEWVVKVWVKRGKGKLICDVCFALGRARCC